ncbi:hypothetical protein GQ53DRAFT_832162 [Thozetella sp. PMI_491]|nr:hypothetical protein GQ53DRAFT_832162 [Thozetella sp. PMI_491]
MEEESRIDRLPDTRKEPPVESRTTPPAEPHTERRTESRSATRAQSRSESHPTRQDSRSGRHPAPLDLTIAKAAQHMPGTLKRSQSEAQMQRTRARWKELPPRPSALLSPMSAGEVIRVGQVIGSPSESSIKLLASPPPTGPLPLVPAPSSRPMESLDAAVRRITGSDAVMSPTASSERSSAKESERSSAGAPPRRPLRHSVQERIWLHRNYKGEAPFLAAWGLDIQSEEDRREGNQILKELMQAEESEGTQKEAEEKPSERAAESQGAKPVRRHEHSDSVTEAYLDDRLSRLGRANVGRMAEQQPA